MKILSYKPGHDGAVAYLEDNRLVLSIEAEKNSNYRYSPLGIEGVLDVLGEIGDVPDVVCTGGWWPNEARLPRSRAGAEYRGISPKGILTDARRVLGRPVKHFSSSHERSHLLCAYGMSPFRKGTPCYALIWEGVIGAFYEIDSDLNIALLANVLSEPGNRYTLAYGLADPTFAKDSPFSRFSDSGKLMALASFAGRNAATEEEEKLIEFLLNTPNVRLSLYGGIERSRYYNVGVDDQEFRNFAGIVSGRIFDIFYRFAKANMKGRLPLLIAGGCGLNCDWNSRWMESGLFPDVFVPPVANDSGSAIGTAIDAQFYHTGHPKIEWDVYSGLEFDMGNAQDLAQFEVREARDEAVAEMLAEGLILGWVNGKYEIGPRALGNRSILAAPFSETSTNRLNEIKQRERYRPIAPVCLEEDAARWFGCDRPSPHMLFTYPVNTDALAAVTHVNKTARVQTVSPQTNRRLCSLLTAFKKRTGYGVLCNTSLNLSGKGFINNFDDLAVYAIDRGLDGFVVAEKCYTVRSSSRYQTFLARG